MNKKILICGIFFSNLIAMDEPPDWVKRLAAKISPRKTAAESPRSSQHSSPRTNEKVVNNPLKKEPSPRNADINQQDCIALANLALEIDLLYRNGKEVIETERVETAYIKAIKCFVTTFEQNKQNATLYLTKLHALFLQLKLEEKQANPTYVMSAQIAELNRKAYDFIKSYVNEGSQ